MILIGNTEVRTIGGPQPPHWASEDHIGRKALLIVIRQRSRPCTPEKSPGKMVFTFLNVEIISFQKCFCDIPFTVRGNINCKVFLHGFATALVPHVESAAVPHARHQAAEIDEPSISKYNFRVDCLETLACRIKIDLNQIFWKFRMLRCSSKKGWL